jgi:hypothetical protein
MWCLHCRQDVPALSSGDKLCCSRCGEGICADQTAAVQAPAYDGFLMDEQLRHIGRLLHGDDAKIKPSEDIFRREAAHFDISHAKTPAWHASSKIESARKTELREQRNPKTSEGGLDAGSFASLALWLGAASFACGGILLGWSLATGRQELWTIGLPVALFGQIALLIALMLQLDRLWRDNRASADKLDNVDEQLGDLKTAATLLGANQGPAAGAFYSHFAGGASPHLLLTDLKGQIDLLAMKIAQDER